VHRKYIQQDATLHSLFISLYTCTEILLGARPILHISRIKVNAVTDITVKSDFSEKYNIAKYVISYNGATRRILKCKERRVHQIFENNLDIFILFYHYVMTKY
jgi:hypothetical protein